MSSSTPGSLEQRVQPVTETEPPLPTDVASPPPVGLVVVLWIGAFSLMVWGLMVLFKPRLRASPRGGAESDEAPRDPDVTLDQPGPSDRGA